MMPSYSRRRVAVRIPDPALRAHLNVPDGAGIVGLTLDHLTTSVIVVVAHPDFPEVAPDAEPTLAHADFPADGSSATVAWPFPEVDPDPVQASIDETRATMQDAEARLIAAIEDACPGPHKPVQHRDGLPPWCKACRRTRTGTAVQ